MDPKKILIVDDDKQLALTLAQSINSRGKFSAYAVFSGEEALEYLEENPEIDLVVTDIKMGGISGLELLSRIRSQHPQIGVVVMTGYSLPEIREEALFRGSLAYIEKPFDSKDLEKTCERALKISKLKDKPVGFSGKIVSLSLVDIIQMNCLSRATNAIIVESGKEQGIIYFKQGEIVHCEQGELEGEEAFYQILGWQGGFFQVRNNLFPPKETINIDWNNLLMEGMRRIDESGISSRSPPEEEIDLEEAFSFLEKEQKENQKKEVKEMAGVMETIESLLGELVAGSPDVEGAALVGSDGLIIAAHLPVRGSDPNRIGASIAALLGLGKRTVETMAQGDFQELSLTGSKGAIYLYDAGETAVLGIIAKAEANVGMINMLARDISKKIEGLI